MGRNKKDAANFLPVDRYRREIGKQDFKKSKSELKETKLKAQAKQSKSEIFKELFLFVGSFVVIIGFIFVLLYLYLDKRNEFSKETSK